jgi:two-component system response regulator
MSRSNMKPLSQDILLVEDDARDVELTLREFENYDCQHRIVVLRDGAEALKFLFAESNTNETACLPRAILIGWKLPKVDGVALLHLLKANERTREIPAFLLISATQDIEHLAKGQIQPDGYLVKPVGFMDLNRLLDSNRNERSPAFEAKPAGNRN